MKTSPVLDNELLKSLGVLDWGYTEDPLPHSFQRYDEWINSNLNRPLQYLSDHRKDLRQDLRFVYPDFQSALVFLFSYQETKKWMLKNGRHDVAAYSLGFGGEDYHFTLKKRLQAIAASIPDAQTFISLDAQPVLERDLAFRAGLGWFGKNSMLINRKEGSYFIIGSLLLNKKLSIELSPLDYDHCGQCTACADACPTNAINVQTRTLAASHCISTFTIEIMKESEPPIGYNNSRGEIFGCDICQDVCPWNYKPLARVIERLDLQSQFTFVKSWFYEWPREKLKSFIAEQTNRGLKKLLSGSPFDRPGKSGWLKNFK